jgi:hypothetical protein
MDLFKTGELLSSETAQRNCKSKWFRQKLASVYILNRIETLQTSDEFLLYRGEIFVHRYKAVYSAVGTVQGI